MSGWANFLSVSLLVVSQTVTQCLLIVFFLHYCFSVITESFSLTLNNCVRIKRIIFQCQSPIVSSLSMLDKSERLFVRQTFSCSAISKYGIAAESLNLWWVGVFFFQFLILWSNGTFLHNFMIYAIYMYAIYGILSQWVNAACGFNKTIRQGKASQGLQRKLFGL